MAALPTHPSLPVPTLPSSTAAPIQHSTPPTIVATQYLTITVVRTDRTLVRRGEGMQRAADLAREALKHGALRQLNDRLAALGIELHISVENDQDSPEQAATLAQAIVAKPGASCVVGHYSSGPSIAAAPIYASHSVRMLMITPASSNPTITDLGETIWRLVATDDRQGSIAYQFVSTDMLPDSQIVIVRVADNAYADGLESAFSNASRQARTTNPALPDISRSISFQRPAHGDPDFSSVALRSRR